MMMTLNAHQTYYNALLDFYQNPKLYTSENPINDRGDSFCHVSVFGPTTHRFSGLDANCERVRSYRDIRTEIKAAVEDEGFDKVLLELDGPGGEGTGCFDLAEYIAEMSKIKPIIGFINGSSYSANYAIGSACTELYASPNSYGGSIGVIYGREERTRDGRKVTYFTSGEAKADGQPFLELTKEEAQRNQSMVDDMADSFFNLVASRRNIKPEEVKALQANIFSAEKMLELGLIDGIKTEEEIKSMMISSAKHQRIVDEIKTEHENEVLGLKAENTKLNEDVIRLTQQVTDVGETQTELLREVSELANSAGVPDMAVKVVVEGADLETAKSEIKKAAAARDEDISLTTSITDGDETYDMLTLIKDA